LKRWQATMVDGAIAIAGLLYVLIIDSGNFLANLNSYIVLAICWIGPFGAVYLLDLWWRNWHVRPEHIEGRNSPFAGFAGPRQAAWIASAAGILILLLTIASPKFNGPIAKALDKTDLSWATGPIVAGGLYWVLARKQVLAEVAGHDAAHGALNIAVAD
jgi:nucleobase:cation symporter-1, NCS1 family